ncbi:anhydro-N-acetylmuramic acid kinase [Marinicella litoralis]|uniref:Anhydro-N-acetylmuramic acid kinase n=1 Tax=Marinicella litoralis TaxID=644220 RepID=A0A4R6XGG9_9GAMM|nr:anhydro-N-acetylmuramic acid kinase [Marinicella litoralis]TDR18482.1 anhydro-N-acetylmuramic acid kinase [Marinicella litoralis]
MQYIGVMSGTSCDGVDIALMNFDHGVDTIATSFQPYDNELKAQLLKLIANKPFSVSAISQIDARLAHLYANTINDFLHQNHISRLDVKAIGLHGQTVFHDPDSQYANTIQLGSAATVAKATGILTVNNFRQMDVACGGQGAPLAPIFHQQMFQQPQKKIIVLNLGGIANISLLKDNHILGFDTGPANCLCDEWMMKQNHKPYDEGGSWAKQGKVNTDLLSAMLDDPYFSQPHPKSTGRELFNVQWLNRYIADQNIDAVDVQRTLLQLTVESVVEGINLLNQKIDTVVVCGGGVHNKFMMTLLQNALQVPVESSAVHGIDPDFVEAALMAWLAEQNIKKNRLNLMAVTGADCSLIYGVPNIP